MIKITAKKWNSYKKQRNFCLKLLRQSKEKYFNNVDVKKYLIIKPFGIKPFVSNRALNSTNVLLMEENEIVNDDRKIATIMNSYFTNITKHMNLKASNISHQEKLVNILDIFKNHMSVQRVRLANFHSYSTVSFSKVTESDVRE